MGPLKRSIGLYGFQTKLWASQPAPDQGLSSQWGSNSLQASPRSFSGQPQGQHSPPQQESHESQQPNFSPPETRGAGARTLGRSLGEVCGRGGSGGWGTGSTGGWYDSGLV